MWSVCLTQPRCEDTKTTIFFTLSQLQSVRSQREWKLILTQGIWEEKRGKKKKKKNLRCVEIMRSLDVFWEDMGWCRQMHNSHLHPRTQTHTHTRGTFNHNFKTQTFACVYALTLKSATHTPSHIIWMHETLMHMYLHAHLHSCTNTNWLVD